jgi:hypothetical protein
MKNNRINTTGGSQAPSESGRDNRFSSDDKQGSDDLREGSIRKAEETSTSRDAFGDDFAVELEEEISQDNAKSEDEND